ncbi:MAG: DUF1722 domain-containing protein [Idiomarina sp.]|nr:DUF1722 domain-containing protein [Idiomarina sp.]
MSIKVGISACLLGQKVRYDGGHKGSQFCQHDLGEFVEYVALCPEVGIGLPVPRPTIRLEGSNSADASAVIPKTNTDVTEALSNFADQHSERLAHISGYVLCAKSPSCGMERVRLYEPSQQANRKEGVGIFARRLRELYPALPMEEDGRLNDPLLRENFVLRLYVYAEWQELQRKLTKKSLYDFHTRHKLLLLAHNQSIYRALGRRLGELTELTPAFANEYIQAFMDGLGKPATRSNHTNVLQHVQGYFKSDLDEDQRAELAEVILAYHGGEQPLIAPLTLLKHYQRAFPKPYLKGQSYFQPYPEKLRLRYGL